ncbi:hypothetical protein [Eudoraea adriatica]|uniref:hypothetical protein n=1 Tax=Eudoraea adriatica TaxID=446681 RepID=UPI00036F7F2D|nr:hypothetical protein [Eudoraea adriatica]
MKTTVILSILILLISCGEVVKKSPEMTQARIDSLRTIITDLDREIGIISDNAPDSNHPIVIHLTALKDSLESLLP